MKYNYSAYDGIVLRVTDKKTGKVMSISREITMELEDMLVKYSTSIDHEKKVVVSYSPNEDADIKVVSAYLSYLPVPYYDPMSMDEYMEMGSSRPRVWKEKDTDTIWILSYDYTHHMISVDGQRRQISLRHLSLLANEEDMKLYWEITDWVVNEGAEFGKSPDPTLASGSIYKTGEGRAVVVENMFGEMFVLSASVFTEGIEEWYMIAKSGDTPNKGMRTSQYIKRSHMSLHETHSLPALLSVFRQYYSTEESKKLLEKECRSNMICTIANLMLLDKWGIVEAIENNQSVNVTNSLTDAGKWDTTGYVSQYPSKMHKGVVLYETVIGKNPLSYVYEGNSILIPEKTADVTLEASIGIKLDGRIYFVHTKTELKKLGPDYYKEYSLLKSLE